ncbi:hypothetical protein ACN20G_28210 (plasmid) [Streptomyces sp. BI20]|uniref:hypothetical protein n=1 Tax=Streptomyces sp. BI20 TaxID=3403460 RepID=UPI003C758EA9
MAIAGTTVTKFVPAIWSAKILVALRNAHVFGQSGVINRDYEGDIKRAGDRVNITAVKPPTIGKYVPHKDIKVESLVDTDDVLIIDQAPYFAFELDDIENAQALSGGAVMGEAASLAAYGLAEEADKYLADQMHAGARTKLTVDITADPADAWTKLLVPLRIAMDKQKVPFEGRWLIVPPEVHGALLLDSRFVKVNESGTEQGLRNGIVGRAAGFDIMMSNNCDGATTPTPKKGRVLAGHRMGCTFAQQIAKTEAFKMELRFNQGLKGLHLYGSKVIRPEVLVSASVTHTTFFDPESITISSGGSDAADEPAPAEDEGTVPAADEPAGDDASTDGDDEGEAPAPKGRRR